MVLNNSQFCLKFQVPLFMMNIYKSLTEDDGQSAGVLKNLLEEPDMDKLLNNPFKITAGDVKVIQSGNNFFIFSELHKNLGNGINAAVVAPSNQLLLSVRHCSLKC